MDARPAFDPDSLEPDAPRTALPAALRRPQVILPIGIIVLLLFGAVVIQPGGGGGSGPRAGTPSIAREAAPADETPTAQPTATARTSPTPEPRTAGSATPSTTSEVAGARATPSQTTVAEAELAADLAREATECGSIQETTIALSVEQALTSVSIRVTRATVYPIDYFRCILSASSGRDSLTLASALNKAAKEGATHAAVVDLWIANGGRDFGQVNLRSASVAAAGQVFTPIATLGGRGEVVVSSGEGRNLALVTALRQTVGATSGPMTLTVDAPLIGGKQTAGKYSLFLPTP